MVNTTEVFCISNSAPIAKVLLNTEISAGFNYGGVDYKVFSKS